MVTTSRNAGVLERLNFPGASIVAGINAREAFFAPLMRTVPESGLPP
jgi:hypothetical protein